MDQSQNWLQENKTHEDLDFVARKRRDFMYVFPLGQMLQLQRCD